MSEVEHVINKNEWKDYFNFFTKGLEGKSAELEVAGLDLGDQIETEWVPLEGISYDHKDDILTIHTPRIDHHIHHPQTIVTHERGGLLELVEVKDQENEVHIVRLKEPLKLPAPKS